MDTDDTTAPPIKISNVIGFPPFKVDVVAKDNKNVFTALNAP